MISFIKLKNFKSFDNVEFDFRETSTRIKKFISIYGENGSGKSNFVDALRLLRELIESFSVDESVEMLKELLQRKDAPDLPSEIQNQLFQRTLTNVLDKARMIDCEDATCIECGFLFNGHKGTYKIEFKDQITYESLYYFTGKQSGQLFEIRQSDEVISYNLSRKLFKNTRIESLTKELISQYWGKHSMLSILKNEAEKKNTSYILDNYTEYVFECITMFKELMIHTKSSAHSETEYRASHNYNHIEDLEKGKIHSKYKSILDSCERILNNFFTQAYADIKEVYYNKKAEKEILKYQLFVKKMIGGKLRTIPFSKESAGTQHLLIIIRSLLGTLSGDTVVYDEIDNGIHDLLFSQIVSSIIDEISGQLIITTHNTLLMESLNAKSVYVINVDYEGKKSIDCLTDYPRIQQTNNTAHMYLRGMFGGVPNVDYIDYDEIKEEVYEMDKLGMIKGGED